MTKRMKANSHFSYSDHGVEHEYNRYCDEDEPRCEPLDEPLTQVDLDAAIVNAAIKWEHSARKADKAMRAQGQIILPNCWWLYEDAAAELSNAVKAKLDAERRKSLEEVLVRLLTSIPEVIEIRFAGTLEEATRELARGLRQAFPELKDK